MSTSIIEKKGLHSLTSRGGSGCSHKLIESKSMIELRPVYSDKTVATIFLSIVVLFALIMVYLLILGVFGTAFLFLIFTVLFGFGYKTYVNRPMQTTILLKPFEKVVLISEPEQREISFDEIDSIELVNKTKPGGQSGIINTAELNIILNKNGALNLTTGGDIESMLRQAVCVGKLVEKSVYHDNEWLPQHQRRQKSE